METARSAASLREKSAVRGRERQKPADRPDRTWRFSMPERFRKGRALNLPLLGGIFLQSAQRLFEEIQAA